MREQLCDALVLRSGIPDTVFLTGDLGFKALEPLKEALGDRFVNAGVAEQNMISVAAALAVQGLQVWVYSIAPFVYARPFEQIRNDVCLHGLPVKLIGNGGGYGYGVMGPTHHAIEDYGVLLTLPGMTVLVPAFDEDVAAVVSAAAAQSGPTYIRMGRGEHPEGWRPPDFAPWRQLVAGREAVVLTVGPIVGSYLDCIEGLSGEYRPNLWVAGALPISSFPPPDDLLSQISQASRLVVVEEHVRQGSLGSQLMLYFAEHGIEIPRFTHMTARAHNYGSYGSQTFLRAQASLDASSLLEELGRD